MNHSRHAARTALALLAATALGLAPAAHAYYAGGGKDAAKGNDCLIGYEGIDASDVTDAGSKKQAVMCTDCDPSCDHDNSGVADGSCTFEISACINQSGVEGCTPATGLTKASGKGKVKGQKGKVSIEVPQLLEGSACGALLNLVVPVKMTKKGDKDGSGIVKLSAVQKKNKSAGVDKTRKDKDKLKFVCMPREGECPAITTTTVTTTSTTVTTLMCPPPTSGPTRMDFTTGTNVTDNCGGPGFLPAANPPFTGSIFVHDAGTNMDYTLDLGAGCLYIGGGAGTVPGGATPDGSTSKLTVTGDCGDGTLQLGAFGDTNDPDNMLSCTLGGGPGKSCFNDLSSFPLPTCTTDADCGGAAGSCVDTPNCFFGPPLPIANGTLSTCVVNSFGVDASGSVDTATGEATLSFPLRSHTFITGNNASPCPKCIGNMCTYGANAGNACTPVGTQQVSLDCPPSGANNAYLPEFSVTLSPLSTSTITRTAADGIFCPGQGTNPGDSVPGAFGTKCYPAGVCANPQTTATSITQQGSASGALVDLNPHEATLVSVFCIPATTNVLIDGAAGLPGPGSVSLPGQMQLQ